MAALDLAQQEREGLGSKVANEALARARDALGEEERAVERKDVGHVVEHQSVQALEDHADAREHELEQIGVLRVDELHERREHARKVDVELVLQVARQRRHELEQRLDGGGGRVDLAQLGDTVRREDRHLVAATMAALLRHAATAAVAVTIAVAVSIAATTLAVLASFLLEVRGQMSAAVDVVMLLARDGTLAEERELVATDLLVGAIGRRVVDDLEALGVEVDVLEQDADHLLLVMQQQRQIIDERLELGTQARELCRKVDVLPCVERLQEEGRALARCELQLGDAMEHVDIDVVDALGKRQELPSNQHQSVSINTNQHQS